jgi:aconitate hydratase
MPKNLTHQLIENHLVTGSMKIGDEIGIKIDQTLTQDATGTMVMLELLAMGCKQVKTEISAQYVDHNILETDFKNADDHIFLRAACRKMGIWYSRAGNGVSHPVHMERFGIPKKTMLGSDSHTCAAGSLGMLAIGAGGLEVALAMMGEPFYLSMPTVLGVHLVGELSDFVSAKDVILEMLRRYGVGQCVDKVIEYHGPGLPNLTAMDRHVIANMGAELGATTSIFPSDDKVREFLESQGRGQDFHEFVADKGASYDEEDEIDLGKIEPLIACPQSPANVVPVREVAGLPIFQAMIGSSANPGLRDFAVPALMVRDKKIHPQVSFDINPTSRQILENLVKHEYLSSLIRAGARIHQAGCNGCIGMGQAPATDKISLRTNPRNFPGRSGTKEDLVYLCSPETAAASALAGQITDPRDLAISYPSYQDPKPMYVGTHDLEGPPFDVDIDISTALGPNIKPLPVFDALLENFSGPVLLKVHDNISTDEILPAGSAVLPYRSNIPKIAEFAFKQVDENFYARAKSQKPGFIIAGKNYGQGSSREHAAIVTRYLGILAVVAGSYARIHRDNLINFGVLPLIFVDNRDRENIALDDILAINNVSNFLQQGEVFAIKNQTTKKEIKVICPLSMRETQILLAGGLIRLLNRRLP